MAISLVCLDSVCPVVLNFMTVVDNDHPFVLYVLLHGSFW